MRNAQLHVDGDAGPDGNRASIERDDTGPPDNEPVLGPPRVGLIAQPLSGKHDDVLHLVVLRVVRDGVVAPGSLVVAIRLRPILA